MTNPHKATALPSTVPLNADAHDALTRIRAVRALPPPGDDKEVARRREEVRSYAVEFVNAIERDIDPKPTLAECSRCHRIAEMHPQIGDVCRRCAS